MTPESCRSKKREVEHDHDLEGGVGDSVALPDPCKDNCCSGSNALELKTQAPLQLHHHVVHKALRSVIEARNPLQLRELVVVEDG